MEIGSLQETSLGAKYQWQLMSLEDKARGLRGG